MTPPGPAGLLLGMTAPRPPFAALDMPDAASLDAPELCVVVPTFNERDNVPVLAARLASVLRGVAWEAVFVDDDSPDGTAQIVR